MKNAFIILAVILATGFCFAQGSSWGVAAIDDAMGIHANPGYLGLGHGFESAMFGSFSSDSNSTLDIENTHGFLLNMNGFGCGYENIVGLKRWSLGAGVGDRTFGIGYLRTWSAHDSWGEGWRNGWIFGTMVRPVKFASAGWAYENTPAMEGHRFGLALRPVTWRVTLFGDVTKPNDVEWEDLSWAVGGELHLVDGIRLFGRYDYYGEDVVGDPVDQISAGFRLDNPFGGVGAIAASGLDDEWSDYTIYSLASSKELPSLFPMPKYSLRITLSGDYSERPRGGFFGGKSKSFTRLIKTLDEAAQDNEVKALVIRYKFPSLNFAQAEELRNVLEKFKENDKPILLYADNLGNLSYYLASVADFIAIPPSGSGVGIIGLHAEMLFFKDALEKVGVAPDFINIGDYKSAMEMFTRTEPSEPAAMNMNEILDVYENEFLSGIAEKLDISPEKAGEVVDNGPYNDLESDFLGLVDSLMYWDEFEEYISDERDIKTQPFGVYAMREHRGMHWGQPDRIAVIVIDGSIIKGSGGGGGLFGGNKTGEKEIIAAVKAAKNNKSVKGILLRISSGGGSALASDLMTHAIKDAADEKPLVVSMGNAAASGGYFVATPGAKIFADNTTITGSIGVISGKFAIGGLYDKIGVTKTIFQRGENSGVFSMSDTFSTAERERIRSSSLRTYDIFKNCVAEGRGLSMDSVDVIGGGRVWPGISAVEIGLVDTIGGFIEALDYLVAESDADEKDLELWLMPGSGDALGQVFDMIDAKLPFKDLREDIPDFPFEDGEQLYLMPFVIEIK